MALLPLWIIGSVLVIAIVDWVRTPKGTRNPATMSSGTPFRTVQA